MPKENIVRSLFEMTSHKKLKNTLKNNKNHLRKHLRRQRGASLFPEICMKSCYDKYQKILIRRS